MTADRGSVTVTREGAIATVTFDRRIPANPLSIDLMRDLTAAARDLQEDTTLSAVILRGRSDTFSMGFDLSEEALARLTKAPLVERRNLAAVGRRMCQAWEDLPQLTISAIEGWCIGGGAALAVATDLRVLSRTSTLYVPEIERGLSMSWGSIPRITALVGPARAKRLILLAEKLSAEAALSWGLADEISEPGGTIDVALQLAGRAADMPPVALHMGKTAINAYANALARVATHADHDQFTLTLGSDDAKEGIAAFRARRDPRYTGN